MEGANSATLIIPDSFFEGLEGIPEDEKAFVISHRQQTRSRLSRLEEKLQDRTAEILHVTSPIGKGKRGSGGGKRRPRKERPPHLRCVAVKTRKTAEDESDQCKRYNKMPKDATAQQSLDEFSEDGRPSDLLYCNGHDFSNGCVEGIREKIAAMVEDAE